MIYSVVERVWNVSPLPLGEGQGVRAWRPAPGKITVHLSNRPHPSPLPEGEGTVNVGFPNTLLDMGNIYESPSCIRSSSVGGRRLVGRLNAATDEDSGDRNQRAARLFNRHAGASGPETGLVK
jgi:hypothetical protein